VDGSYVSPICSRCGKPGEFGLDVRTKNGFRSWCKNCVCEAGRRYREKYPDRVVEAKQRYVEKHKDRAAALHRARARTYYARHPEKVKALVRKFNLVRPERHREYKKRWRARRSGAACTLTRDEWLEIVEYFGDRCAYCNVRLTDADGPKHAKRLTGRTQDHVEPLSKGGAHAAENVVPSCLTCNCSKNARGVLCMVNVSSVAA
jgi:hypothetical protein